MSARCVLCLLLCLALICIAQPTLRPLIFDIEDKDAQRVKIYWNPNVEMKKIKELYSRDIRYVVNNVTNKVREEAGPWRPLVSEDDNVDASRRLVFLKSDKCVEQDFRISWYDVDGSTHENITQRMEPSPEIWKPTAKIEIANLRFDSIGKRIVGSLSWAMSDEKLKGVPKLGAVHPTIQMNSCRTLFGKPVPLPEIDEKQKTVTFDTAYAEHGCTFTARLRQMTYRGDLECRSLRETSDEQSDHLALTCSQGLPAQDCHDDGVDPGRRQVCHMQCSQNVTVKADYDWSRYWPKPVVKVSWAQSDRDRQALSHVIRYAEVDAAVNNYPVEEFNATVVRLGGNETFVQLTPFSNAPDSFYTFQACTIFEPCLTPDPIWNLAPRYAVHAKAAVDKLPPPPATTARPSTRKPKPTTTSANATLDQLEKEPRPAKRMIEMKTPTETGEDTAADTNATGSISQVSKVCMVLLAAFHFYLRF